MKYLSVLFFAWALIWTWNIVHSSTGLNTETHSGIQSAMAQLIQATILQKRPHARDFLIQKMRTEEREEGEVRVYFQYAFNEPDSDGQVVATQISGVASLERSHSGSGEASEQWSLKNVRTTNDVISFDKGLMITPGAENSGQATVPPPSELAPQPPTAPAPAPVSPPPAPPAE